MQHDRYLETIERAGFEIGEVRENDYRFVSDRADASPVVLLAMAFACQLATPWIAAIALAFAVGAATLAWVLAVPLLVVAATVMTTNWCLPSLIYGLLHERRGGEPRPL